MREAWRQRPVRKLTMYMSTEADFRFGDRSPYGRGGP